MQAKTAKTRNAVPRRQKVTAPGPDSPSAAPFRCLVVSTKDTFVNQSSLDGNCVVADCVMKPGTGSYSVEYRWDAIQSAAAAVGVYVNGKQKPKGQASIPGTNDLLLPLLLWSQYGGMGGNRGTRSEMHCTYSTFALKQVVGSQVLSPSRSRSPHAPHHNL